MDTRLVGVALTQKLTSLLKSVYSEREEFASNGKQILSFRVDPFSEGDWCIKITFVSPVLFVNRNHKVISLVKWRNIYQI